MRLTYPGIDDLDPNVLGVQKGRIEKAIKDKKLKKPKGSAEVLEGLNEEELYAEILVKVLDSGNDAAVVLAEFDTPEEAERVGLRIDAKGDARLGDKGKGLLGVGIRGTKVSFWRRMV